MDQRWAMSKKDTQPPRSPLSMMHAPIRAQLAAGQRGPGGDPLPQGQGATLLSWWDVPLQIPAHDARPGLEGAGCSQQHTTLIDQAFLAQDPPYPGSFSEQWWCWW